MAIMCPFKVFNQYSVFFRIICMLNFLVSLFKNSDDNKKKNDITIPNDVEIYQKKDITSNEEYDSFCVESNYSPPINKPIKKHIV